ncbi:Antirestriction protein (fragment) [Capnocytophaga canimorsus]|uniref:Antirestriction protein n=1 Tax=Capnocytophaga canimorsus TaxID=28188 RepID=A0A0B7IH88_9FLAO
MGRGSGKTRFAFQFMNDLAQRYKVGHISIEEHPKSRLYKEKAYQYLNPTALNNIEAHDVRSLSEIDKIIRENEVIVIDSFQKIKEIDSKFEVDKDLRKKYSGKLFLVIFQQTTDGKMRGGSKSQFDGDIILFTEKFPNYQENYVYPDKNRYNHIPADHLRYNIFQQRLLPIETEEQTTENQVYDVIY